MTTAATDSVPADLKYSKEHEWVRVLGDDVVAIGITDYAQDALGDIVFVEVRDEASEVAADAPMGEVESTKSVSDIFAPVSGQIVKVNTALDETPELLNSDPYGQGWICEVRLSAAGELDELLTAEQYQEYIGSL